jgi:hypothetical protein
MPRYIVSFYPGSAGRFISNILWSLATGQDNSIELTRFNSAHLSSPWRNNWENGGEGINEHDSNMWQTFSWKADPVILPTHTYPNFELVNSRFERFKTIIITFTTSEFRLIYGNIVYKNGFDLYPTDEAQTSATFNRLDQHYHSLTGVSLKQVEDPTMLPMDITKKLYLKEYASMYAIRIKEAEPFISPQVPSNTPVMLLPYKDILTGKALTTLCQFTGGTVRQSILDQYEKYIKGQHELIKNKMPWLTLDDSYQYNCN